MTAGILPNSSDTNTTKGRKQKQDSTSYKLTLNRISKMVVSGRRHPAGERAADARAW